MHGCIMVCSDWQHEHGILDFTLVRRPCHHNPMQHMNWIEVEPVASLFQPVYTEQSRREAWVKQWSSLEPSQATDRLKQGHPTLHPLYRGTRLRLTRRHQSDRRRSGAWRVDLRFESPHLMANIWLYVCIFLLWSLTRSCSYLDPLGMFAHTTLSCSFLQSRFLSHALCLRLSFQVINSLFLCFDGLFPLNQGTTTCIHVIHYKSYNEMHFQTQEQVAKNNLPDGNLLS